MYKKILITTTLLCLIGLATACKDEVFDNQKSKTPTLQDEENPLAGTKWKLIRMELTTNLDFENREIIDYSMYNVIYDFEFQEDSQKIGYHWTQPANLVVYNNLTSGFPNDLLLEDGKYFYSFRQPSDYFYPDGMHTDYNTNIKIGKHIGVSGFITDAIPFLWCTALSSDSYGFSDISNATDTIRFGNSQGTLIIEGNCIMWNVIFVLIKNGGIQ